MSHHLAHSRMAAIGLPFILLAPVMIFLYRPGSKNEIRDLGVWTTGGENLLQGIDPYLASQGLLKSGPISPVVLRLVQNVFPDDSNLLFYFLMILNLLGGCLFLYWFTKTLNIPLHALAMLSTAICSGSYTREVFVNGQVTGIIFGGVALLALILEATTRKQLRLIKASTVVGIAIFLIDIKPNLTIFLLLYILITSSIKRKLAYISATTTAYIGLFTYLSLATNSNLVMSWWKTLTLLNDYSTNSTLFGSVNLWQIINVTRRSGGFDLLLTVAPILCYLGISIFGLFLALRNRELIGLELIILAPFMYSYWHYYSFLPLIVVIMTSFIRKENLILFGSALSFSFVSFQIVDNLALIMLLGIVSSLLVYKYFGAPYLLTFVTGYLISTSARGVFENLVTGDVLLKSISVSLLVLCWFITYAVDYRKVKSYG